MPTLYPLPGTRLSACGSLLLAIPLELSLATQTMSSPFPSPQITVRSSRDLEIEQSSCGILWATASLPLPTKVTLSGSPAFDSRQILKTRSSLVLDGISLSRCVVIFLSATCPGCFAISIKYLLLQSLRAMRQTFTNALRHLHRNLCRSIYSKLVANKPL